MSKSSLVASLLGIYLSVLPEGSLGQGQRGSNQPTEQRILVRLSLIKRTFPLGDPLKLKVEVANQGSLPFLVCNGISTRTGGACRLEFRLTDSHGRASPAVQLISDSFSSNPSTDPVSAIVGSWLLLRPGDSFVTSAVLDSSFFTFLNEPGKYKLSATYSSTGLSYPPTYRQLGLTEKTIESLSFQSWGGKISTNEVSFEILPRDDRKRTR